jgi:hypothetical protein
MKEAKILYNLEPLISIGLVVAFFSLAIMIAFVIHDIKNKNQ